MDPLWDRIQEIYYSALPMPSSVRGTFVAEACADDPFLMREVSTLLDADDSAGDFLATPIFETGLKIISSNSSNDLDSSAPEDLIGKTVEGRYLIEKKLGAGGMGSVYLARDLRLHHRRIVIKILSQASLKDPYVVKKFRQEVEALARIDHPGVVNVLGSSELADGKPYIAMQYVSGVTLRSEIPSEGMNLERAAAILKQVGAALNDVHEEGIFHRDLKPDNIMLQRLRDGTELVKIVDFGIAKVKDSLIAPSTVDQIAVGTVLYMSPEQLRGDKITATSDIYSIGIIAYEMVTGRRPFNPVSGAQLIEMHRIGVRAKPIDLRPDLSTQAQAVILRALSFERNDRYQNASEFGDSLARALTSDGGTATLKKPDERKHPQSESEPKDLGPVHATIEPEVEALLSRAISRSGANAGYFSWPPWLGSTKFMIVGGLIILVSLAALFGIYTYRHRNQTTSLEASPQRSFTYWLTVQKMRDGKRYQDPFQSSGQEIFENGYKFRMNVASPESGYLYIFNEGPPEGDGSVLTIIYPTRSKSGVLAANQPVQTNWNTFRGRSGTENMWIIWSTGPINQLESAKAEALEHSDGELTNANSISAVREFLAKYSATEPKTTKDGATQTTNVRGTGDVVVKLARLEHR